VESDAAVGGVFRALMNLPILKSALRPITRVIVGVIAIPIFRFIMRRIFRLQDLDEELEKDLEEWFRGALLLLAATANMEHLLFGWTAKIDWMDRADWLTMGLRLMLAIGVIEAMPDQELFAVIHPGPPKIKPGRSVLKEFWLKKWQFLKGFVCQHLNRSSPVLAMMAAIVGAQLMTLSEVDHQRLDDANVVNWSYMQPVGQFVPAQAVLAVDLSRDVWPSAQRRYAEVRQLHSTVQRHRERWLVGWCCYLLAITQYLIIGLVTSRDRALDVLSEFDRAVAVRRRELIEEFQIENAEDGDPVDGHAQEAVLPAAGDDAVISDEKRPPDVPGTSGDELLSSEPGTAAADANPDEDVAVDGDLNVNDGNSPKPPE